MPFRIEDYALIGDCQTAALVAHDGSIDWLCFPRFDSGASFVALLGTPEHGRWQLAPAEPIRSVHRHYRPGTLILETAYETDSGTVAVIDWMPPRNVAPDLMRLVVGRRGVVPLRMELVIRFDYGSVVPWVQRSANGIRATAGPDTLFLHTPVPLHGEDLHTVAAFTVAAGEQVPFTLTWTPTYAPTPAPLDAAHELDRSLVAGVVGPLHLPGRVARGRSALAEHP